jgi:hypothetical protein
VTHHNDLRAVVFCALRRRCVAGFDGLTVVPAGTDVGSPLRPGLKRGWRLPERVGTVRWWWRIALSAADVGRQGLKARPWCIQLRAAPQWHLAVLINCRGLWLWRRLGAAPATGSSVLTFAHHQVRAKAVQSPKQRRKAQSAKRDWNAVSPRDAVQTRFELDCSGAAAALAPCIHQRGQWRRKR